MNPPSGFRWMSEDRRRAMLDRRADDRGERQRREADRARLGERLPPARERVQRSLAYLEGRADGAHPPADLRECERVLAELRRFGQVPS